MKRVTVIVAILLSSLTQVAFGDDMPGSAAHKPGGVGFHSLSAPLGLRWWLGGQKVGLDFGFGFSSSPAESDPDESVSGWAVEAGVPFVCHSWDRAHLLLRPGFLYDSQEVGFGAGPTFDTRTETTFSLAAEAEAEVFLADNVSVSASHGIRFSSFDPDLPGADSQTSFGTFGGNFTEVGFHVYFLGGDQ